MGDFPYPSNYLTAGGPQLPAFPVDAACEFLEHDFQADNDLLIALNAAASVYNNATKDLPCFDFPSNPNQDGNRFSKGTADNDRRYLGLPVVYSDALSRDLLCL